MDRAGWIGPRPAPRELLRGAIGGLIGIGLTALLSRHLLSADAALPWLIAPMGASTVLLFAVPASPFARPWPVLGGHLTAAAIGLVAHRLGGEGWLTIGAAVGLAIAAMGLLRCLHPPAGGTAVLMVLGSPAITAAGWTFLAVPIALNAALLLAFAAAYHRLTGHTYPHRAPADLEAVLADWDEVLDISAADLDALIQAVDRRVRR
jgi:CBS domain-containing membrane protein